MRPEFYDAYRDLNDIYRISQRYPSPFPPFRRREADARMVDDAIDEAVQELNLRERLRPDARLFLLINLHQMVVLPLSYSREMPSPRHALKEMIRDDVRSVLQMAREQSSGEDISGHRIVGVLSRAWEGLRITKLDLWG